MSAWTESGCVPDVISKPPPAQLQSSWGSAECNFGVLTPTQVQDEPKLDIDLEKGAYYTIIMTDPDAPSRADPKFGQWLHWVKVNVTSDTPGDCLAQYVGAGPPEGTGLHRYVLLVYKQADKVDATPLGTFHRADQRPKWNAEKFVEKVGGCSLVAGSFFQAEWDSYVPKLYKKLETMGKVIKKKNWLPLESNPELMNKYVHALGVPSDFVFHEVYGVDEMLLGMVPQPVLAVLMLFPISETSEAHRKEEEAKMAGSQVVSPNVYHMRQVIGNACGTIGLVHAVLNNANAIPLDSSKFFSKFLQDSKGMDLDQRAQLLEANSDIEVSHQSLASEATSEVNHAVNANLHFNAFVQVDGCLYELDGRKERAINHGPCTNLLFDAVAVVKKFMARDPKEIRFNLVALGKADC